MKMIVGLVLAVAWCPLQAYAVCGGASPTWTAVSPNRQDVVDCHTAASNGDTINIPAGTATDWTTTVTITKAVTLQGAGIGQTIIEDNVPTDLTLLLSITPPAATTTTRLTGIEFARGSRPSGVNGMIFIFGQSGASDDGRRFRVDHCKFDHVASVALSIRRAYGLIDHNTFLFLDKTQVYILNGTDYVLSDTRWSASANFGQENFVFMEQNTFTVDDLKDIKAAIDSYGGARWVFRYNDVTNAFLEAHGTESAGRPRGTIAVEVYNNTFHNNALSGTLISTLVGLRSGTAVVHHNTATGFTASGLNAVNLTGQRTSDNFKPWGLSDGRNPWDQNATSPFPGTYTTSGASTGLTVPVLGGTFAVDELAGLLIRKLTAPYNIPIASVSVASPAVITTTIPHGLSDIPGTADDLFITGHLGATPHIMGAYPLTIIDATHFSIGVNTTAQVIGDTATGSVSKFHPNGSSLITSNTPATITYESSFDGGDNLAFASNDTFEITKMTAQLDQPGRMGGTNLGGASNPRWPTVYDQVVEPVYEWENYINGVDAGHQVTATAGAKYQYFIINGTHYFTDHRVKPLYATYQYPHPLQGAVVTAPPGRRFVPSLNLYRP